MRLGKSREILSFPIAVLLALCPAVSGCEVVEPADAEGEAVIYGTASVDGGGEAAGALIGGVVYRGKPCGDPYAARPFQAEADSSGAYRVHLKILTRDPFSGCVEVVGADTALGLISDTVIEEGVYFDITAPFDSVRMDVVLR